MNKAQISVGRRVIQWLTPNILRASKNEMKASNTGMRALIYGKNYSNGYRPGLIHFITAGRFYKEVHTYNHLVNDLSESATVMRSGISKSIPDHLQNAFIETRYMEPVIYSPLAERLAEGFSKVRKGYDILIDKPIARVRSSLYFAKEGVKDFFKGLFKKEPEVDMDFVKTLIPDCVKIPEGLSKSELREYIVSKLKGVYTEKEISQILRRKAPTFYRFVDETELRAIQNGHTIRSSAGYHVDYNRTDITSDPKYNFNKYRITFRRDNKGWNPFEEGSVVRSHELTTKKWWLYGDGYNKGDIVCTERVK